MSDLPDITPFRRCAAEFWPRMQPMERLASAQNADWLRLLGELRQLTVTAHSSNGFIFDAQCNLWCRAHGLSIVDHAPAFRSLERASIAW